MNSVWFFHGNDGLYFAKYRRSADPDVCRKKIANLHFILFLGKNRPTVLEYAGAGRLWSYHYVDRVGTMDVYIEEVCDRNDALMWRISDFEDILLKILCYLTNCENSFLKFICNSHTTPVWEQI